MRKRVIARHLRSSERHQKVSFCTPEGGFFPVSQKRTFFSTYLSGIAHKGHPYISSPTLADTLNVERDRHSLTLGVERGRHSLRKPYIRGNNHRGGVCVTGNISLLNSECNLTGHTSCITAIFRAYCQPCCAYTGSLLTRDFVSL